MNILIDNEPITQEQLEALETKEILTPIERPFRENITNNYNYFKNLEDVIDKSENNTFSEINRIENIDFENDLVIYDFEELDNISFKTFLNNENNFYPTTGDSTPISRKILFIYKESKELKFDLIDKSQLLKYVKTDMRRHHIFFPCSSTSNQYHPNANFNDTFYVKIDILVPFFMEIYDFINMMTSTEGVFYLTPKLDNDGNQQIISKTVSWANSLERDPEAAVSGKHCQDGSNISIYTYELCSESNFPGFCKVSNIIKTRNTEARVDIINLLLSDEIYTRYLLNHQYDKVNEKNNYEDYNEDYINEFKKEYPVSRFDKTIIDNILTVLNEYYTKIKNSIKSYESRKEKRLSEQFNQVLPYYTAKYILEQRKNEKNDDVDEAEIESRSYIKQIQRDYIKDNPDLLFLNYYKNRIEKTFEILDEYKQKLPEVNDFDNIITLNEFMDRIIFFIDINHGQKINQINSLICKIDDIENIDATNNSQTRNIDYDDNGYFKNIKIDLIYLDTIDNTLNEINQLQTPQNNQYQTPQNNQYQTPQNNQYQTPQNNQYQTPPQNNQIIDNVSEEESFRQLAMVSESNNVEFDDFNLQPTILFPPNENDQYQTPQNYQDEDLGNNIFGNFNEGFNGNLNNEFSDQMDFYENNDIRRTLNFDEDSDVDMF